MKSSRGAGISFSFVQVENDIDLNYIKGLLGVLRERLDGQSFMQKRAMHAESSSGYN
jgi:hypothetical protein